MRVAGSPARRPESEPGRACLCHGDPFVLSNAAPERRNGFARSPEALRVTVKATQSKRLGPRSGQKPWARRPTISAPRGTRQLGGEHPDTAAKAASGGYFYP